MLRVFTIIWLFCLSTSAEITNDTAFLWHTTSITQKLASDSEKISYTFNFTNSSRTAISILKVDTTCGCTVPETPPLPWAISGGQTGALKIVFDGQGKSGRIIKYITVITSLGSTTLEIVADLPIRPPSTDPKRIFNQMASIKNRQAVFKGSCANCHTAPTVNKQGKELFLAACGICHTAEHRASMVPDLRTLKTDKTKAYWEQWIRNGKSNTLMPAFEKMQNGILSDEQIKSLVDYLSEDFSSATPSPAITQ